jgi:hypothetical protein
MRYLAIAHFPTSCNTANRLQTNKKARVIESCHRIRPSANLRSLQTISPLLLLALRLDGFISVLSIDFAWERLVLDLPLRISFLRRIEILLLPNLIFLAILLRIDCPSILIPYRGLGDSDRALAAVSDSFLLPKRANTPTI